MMIKNTILALVAVASFAVSAHAELTAAQKEDARVSGILLGRVIAQKIDDDNGTHWDKIRSEDAAFTAATIAKEHFATQADRAEFESIFTHFKNEAMLAAE